MSADELHPQAITALLQEVRQEVKEGFTGLREELRAIERNQVADRRALEQHVNAETRRLDARVDELRAGTSREIGELRSRLDVSKGEARVAGRLWGAASSIITGLALWLITNL